MDPTTRTHEFHDNTAVVDDGRAQLAAIQSGYEEAKAGIMRPRDGSADDAEAFPGTERIDVTPAGLPQVPVTAAPTEGMSAAARYLAQQSALAVGPDTPEPVRPGWLRAVRRALRGQQP